jgi:hypothetical protein
MFKMETIDDLWNHIAYVMAYAPDQFPVEDFLQPDQQMDLDKAFLQLRQGVLIAYPEESFAQRREELNETLDSSYRLYRSGDDDAAVRLLNSFQKEIFKA